MTRGRVAAFATVCVVFSRGTFGSVADEVGRGFLPAGADISSWSCVCREVEALDIRADEAWRALRTREEYDSYRRDLHAKTLRALGGFPERTPLNARTVDTVAKDGYRVEKVVFESMPGLYVTANLYLPEGDGAIRPCPAVVMSCGHAQAEGKDCDTYRRACVLVARRGMAAFMFDPYEQGERREHVGSDLNCCQAHNLIGLKAMLLGWSMPMLRLWDGMRAVDYVQSRPEIDPERIGYMGQSGGGTMTALMTAVDWRLKATAPSCYLSALGTLCRMLGPQDAEQNVFGQLSFGLNHTGYVLLPDTKVCVTGRYDDMFPWIGVSRLWQTVGAVAERLDEKGNYALNFAPGPHGWTESTMTASADWMRAWLCGERSLLPIDASKYRPLDLGFSESKVDCGLKPAECGATPGYSAAKLPGARSIHAILRERLASAEKSRASRSPDETAALVRRLAGIRLPDECACAVREIESVETNGLVLMRLAFQYPNGLSLPAVSLALKGLAPDAPQALMVGAKGRAGFAEDAERAARGGERVLVADVTGTGEIGRTPHDFYGASADTPEEATAVMLYLTGESLVGRRATDILLLADWLKKERHGKGRVRLAANGSVAVAAAHAFAADRGLFGELALSDTPISWTDFVKSPGRPQVCRYAWCVNGALLQYDWPELMTTP